MEGSIEATGRSYIPTQAYVWINLTQVQMDEKTKFTAVANNPDAKAADDSGSEKNVDGSGSLHTLPSVMSLAPNYAMAHVSGHV